jgi:ribosomal protein S18 acetylase RimI-like enzyme
VIRPATRDDAPAIAALEVRAWRWAYVDLVAEEDMPTVADRETGWREGPLDGASVWDQDGRVVGVVQTGAREDEPGVGALLRLYVDPAAQGAGIGAALHDHAVAQLTAAGPATATLWVFTADGHAREFFAARGWAPDGGRGGRAGVPELRYRRTLRG